MFWRNQMQAANRNHLALAVTPLALWPVQLASAARRQLFSENSSAVHGSKGRQ
jgi:hypothetical protein